MRIVLLALVLGGCGGALRDLAPIGGDTFTFFAPPSGTASAITCGGDAEVRWECATRQIEDRFPDHDVSGALVLAIDEEPPRFYVRSATPDTRFFVASVSKMFLAAAAVSLSLEGQLDLDAPLSRVLSELEGAELGHATIAQLLSHTSGLPVGAECTPGADLADVVRSEGTRPLLAPPGAVWNYSNVGYAFVAAAIERVTSERFEDVVRARVLVPAGIPDATYDPAAVTLTGRPAAQPVCRAMRPAGGLALTIRELGVWASGMARTDPPLGRALVDMLVTPRASTGLGVLDYGFGVGQREHEGLTFHTHSGGLPGFSSFVAWEATRHVAVAALMDEPGGLPAGASLRMLSTFLDLSADWSPSRAPAHPLGRYAGEYRDEAGTLGRVRIGVEGDHLALDYLDAPPPLLPSEIRFQFTEGTVYLVTPVGVATRVP